jgi:hypothetical protein
MNSGGQAAQRFIDASQALFERAQHAPVVGGFLRPNMFDGHFETAHFDHQVMTEEERIETERIDDCEHGTNPCVSSPERVSGDARDNARGVPTRRMACHHACFRRFQLFGDAPGLKVTQQLLCHSICGFA